MARCDHLPILNNSMKISLGIERAAMQLSRHHKYALGVERIGELEQLTVEQVKNQQMLAREPRCCASFVVWAKLAATAIVTGKRGAFPPTPARG
jgi:hypothetical protein